jgi:cation diffusion facilitator CzcD-associated flavoprotein CzcO
VTTETDLLIIGAGPFGLAIAAQAAHAGIEHLIVGKPMEFWRRHMPKGMYLRSACDWHLDPAEGRMKLEPWLGPRVQNDRVHVRPRTEVLSCRKLDNGELEVELSNGETVVVEQIILATGYKVNIAQLPVLASGNILAKLKTRNGFPELDDHFETSYRACSSRACPRRRTLAHSSVSPSPCVQPPN